MKISKMKQEAKVELLSDICKGLQKLIEKNPEMIDDLLTGMVDGFLDPMAAEDFFGTEGWERGLGIE